MVRFSAVVTFVDFSAEDFPPELPVDGAGVVVVEDDGARSPSAAQVLGSATEFSMLKTTMQRRASHGPIRPAARRDSIPLPDELGDTIVDEALF